jgi:hypothetical protein
MVVGVKPPLAVLFHLFRFCTAKAHELERLLPWAWKAERLAAAVHA